MPPRGRGKASTSAPSGGPVTRATAPSTVSKPLDSPPLRLRTRFLDADGSPFEEPPWLSRDGLGRDHPVGDANASLPFQQALSTADPAPSSTFAHLSPVGESLVDDPAWDPAVTRPDPGPDAADDWPSPPQAPGSPVERLLQEDIEMLGGEVDADLDEEVAIAAALSRLTPRLKVKAKSITARVRDLKAKIETATSDAAIAGLCPADFKAEIHDFLKRYRDQVEQLAACRSYYRRLQQHRTNKSFPTALNSLKAPVIQFSRPFLSAPAEVKARGVYDNPRGGTGNFEQVTESAVRLLKEQVLKRWIDEKKRELGFLTDQASAVGATVMLESTIEQRLAEMLARWDYLTGNPRAGELIAQVEFSGAVMFVVASTIVAKLNQLVLTEEDRRLAAALKKMDIDKPIVKAAAKAPQNEPSELKKFTEQFTKELREIKGRLPPKGKGQGKVFNFIHASFLNIADLLKLPLASLINLFTEAIWEVWEDAQALEGEGEGPRKRKTGQGQKGRQTQSSRPKGKSSGRRGQESQGQQKGKRWEEEWSQVVATCGLSLTSDDDRGEYMFNDMYSLDLSDLRRYMSFLFSSIPPSVLLDRRLDSVAPVLCYIFIVQCTSPKINIFDANTYPNLIVRIDFDIAVQVMCRFAPSWLLGSCRFTSRLHTNLEIDLPKEVVENLSAGLKFINPIEMKKGLVIDAWDNLCKRATSQWDQAFGNMIKDHLAELEEGRSNDPFYGIPIPFEIAKVGKDKKRRVREPQPDDDKLETILQAGWTELGNLLKNVPYLDKNDRSVKIELKDTLEWCTQHRVLVKPTDKNLGTALVTQEWYTEKVDNFLLNTKGYKIVSRAEAVSHIQDTVMEIRDISENNATTKTFQEDMSSFLGARLPPVKWQKDSGGNWYFPVDKWEELVVTLPIFNGLPKIHKTPWGIRPVVPCHSVIQGPCSEILSKILKGLHGDHPQILTSTRDLVHLIEGGLNPKLHNMTHLMWRDRVFICTADIEGFYVNVPIVDCRNKLSELILDHFGRDREGKIKSDYVLALFDIQQNNLVMKAKIRGKWEYVLQTDGLAMGMPAAPDIANLFAAWYEKRFAQVFYDHCLLFKRYIDDVICIVSANNLDHCVEILGNYTIPGLKLNWEISETNSVFLDLEIWRNPHSHNHRLMYRPYRKPNNNFERLPWCTGHALQMLRAAFKSEVHRFAVASCNTSIYKVELDWLKDLYISRGYPPETVIAWINKFKVTAYKNRLDRTLDSEEGTDRLWPLKSVMNPVWQKLSLKDVSESMRKAAQPFIDEEQKEGDDHHPFTDRFQYWFRRLVASQKRPNNMGDKENKHNRELLGIKAEHSKLRLTEMSDLELAQENIEAVRRQRSQFRRDTEMPLHMQMGIYRDIVGRQ
jgi:hypothetical protein